MPDTDVDVSGEKPEEAAAPTDTPADDTPADDTPADTTTADDAPSGDAEAPAETAEAATEEEPAADAPVAASKTGARPKKAGVLVKKFSRPSKRTTKAAHEVKKVEKTSKAQESEQQRTARLDAPHKFVLGRVGQLVNITEDDAVTAYAKDPQSDVDGFDDFFAQDGKTHLLFYYKSPNEDGKGTRLFNGEDQPVEEKCIYCVRSTPKAITIQNVANELTFGVLNGGNGRAGILEGMEALLENFLVPALGKSENWGKLSPADKTKDQFLDSLEKFRATLTEAKSAVESTVVLEKFQPNETAPFNLENVKTPSDYTEVANDPAKVTQLEELMQTWCHQIEQMLVQSEQMRKEAYNVGPKVEIVHWKRRMGSFNGLLDQLKSQECTAVVGVLIKAKSRLVSEWRSLDKRITEQANEAKDNVKYLYTLEKFCEPLYKANPVDMLDGVPGLINAVRMIHSISTHYNTSERLTALLAKVTNQMITACIEYVYETEPRVWEQEKDVCTKRLGDCKTLNDRYQECFRKEKEKLEAMENGTPLELSEMSIFGKFNAFCVRGDKVVELMELISQWQLLTDVRIDGLEVINASFRTLVGTLKKKPYDPLNTRETDFDRDFVVFKNDIEQLAEKAQELMVSTVEGAPTVFIALGHLQRFEKIRHVGLDLNGCYEYCLNKFRKELEAVRKVYQKDKESPPVPRNMPPLSGRIVWSRQLFAKIEGPMRIFQENAGELLKSPEHKQTIKNYNKLGRGLMEFELLVHKAWWQAVDSSISGLQASLLVRHPESGKLLCNLDPKTLQLMRETKVMQRLNVEIPASALELVMHEDRIQNHKGQLELMLLEYDDVTSSIPEVLTDLAQRLVDNVDEKLAPGLKNLTWMSLSLDAFLEEVYASLNHLKETIGKANDILNVRIFAFYKGIQTTTLIELSDTEPINPLHMAGNTETLTYKQGKEIERKSALAELAATELNRLLHDAIPASTRDTPEVTQSLDNLKEELKNQCIQAVTKSVRSNLEQMKRRLTRRSQAYNTTTTEEKPPVFIAEAVLDIPNVVMKPAIEEIQQAVVDSVQHIINVASYVYYWEEDRENENAKTLLSQVSAQKDVMKLQSNLSTSVNQTKQEVTDELAKLAKYEAIWKEDREAKTAEFLESNPDLHAFEAVVREYEEYETEVNGLPASARVGAILLSTEPFKVSVTVETKAWKQSYGKNLNKKAYNDMTEVLDFCGETSKSLGRKIVDLEDVRSAMVSLKSLRENEIRLDNLMGPIDQSYGILSKYDVSVPKHETERLDALQFEWKKLNTLAREVQDHLIVIQPEFKTQLLESVEVYIKDVNTFVSDYNIKGPMVSGIPPSEASDRLQVFQTRFDELWRKFITYSGGEELFGLTKTEYPELQRIKKELGLLNKLYGLYNDVNKRVDGYYDILWAEVDIEKINQELLEFGNRCRKLPKALKDWDAFNELRQKIDDFSECCPLMESMSARAMLPRHWKRISETTGVEFDIESENFLLRNIMEAPLLENKEEIEDICIAAVKEEDIEAKLKQVIAEWSAHEVTFMPFKTRGELLINAGEISELTALMEDSLMVLGSLMSNRYNAPFKPEIQKWVRALSDSSEIVERWLVVQNLWVYLEAVFVGGDIAKQLPKEAKRFSNIDKSWVKIMTRAHEVPNLVQCCTGDETMSNILPHLNEQLDVCQKSLVGYLEKKRLVFPRFFFVSDPVLLEILGQASDSHTIQAHLLNIFDNIKTVGFHEKNYDQIISYSSKEGETVEMATPCMASGNVECWLVSLLENQRSSLEKVIADAALQILEPNVNIIDLENNYPAQVGLLGIQCLWTRDAEVALSEARHDKKIMGRMDDKFLQILSLFIDATLTDLKKVDRTKFETLVTIHVHQRDIFHDLVVMNVKSLTDFEWTKQARFYFNEEVQKIRIGVTDVIFKYCNEFIGCVERLCITPLTDRCYITISQALNLGMGAAPAGPAGTGKTETVKDMGRALGKYVVVFNCSDQMDYRGLGRIYKGLAQSGSWGCFDEFNRIELPVLSVAAQQIAIILGAKKEHKARFIFMDGDDVSLDPEFGLFLTMNPGYAGRQELPENLKIQFRSVAMMVPDRQIIIRVKLAACGFQNNVVLARKFYTLYKLCEEQLTKQVHYDFGLRNILSVLRTLGANKRAHPEDGEMTIVMRVLRDMNLSKLVDEDEPLFLSLISDLFPGITLETAGYPELEAAIAKNVEESGLVNHPPWNLKLIQLFETQRVRHGFMVLGPSGAGKTCNITILTKSMTDCGTPHREMRMNPKAITAPQMFGRLDVATNDWTDGIFSTLWRRTLKAKKGEKTWIVLDGPVDAVWIENLNSVLDDNKMLTLANGDRIPMHPDAKLVFEPHNIDNASPATVSRNGMVFMSSSALPWDPILEGWLRNRSGVESETLRELFGAHFENIQSYVTQSLDVKMILLECNYIRQACTLLQGLLPTSEEQGLSKEHVAKLFVFAIMWSSGAVLELDDRKKLQEMMISAKTMDLPPVSGDTDSIFDYYVNENGEWAHWSTKVEKFDYPATEIVPFRSILVPNVDNVRTDFLIDTVQKQNKSVLLIGEPGTAKTVIAKGFCKRFNPEERLFKSMNFSSTTHPNGFQRTIESYIDKRVGSTYGPPGGKKMTVFIDDVNMPIINEWGDQIANEIVRQVMSVQGFYSLDRPGDFTNLADMTYMAAMSHPGGGRNDIPERLKLQFTVFNCTLPSNNSIDLIFSTIGCGYYNTERGFPADVCNTVEKLVAITRTFWQDVKVKMLPTPAKFHYVFNLRDVSRIWEGMLIAPVESIQSVKSLVNLWKHECTRVIADRFTNKKDVEWFMNRIDNNLGNALGEDHKDMLEPSPYFVDFLRDAPEVTGEEPDDADLEAPKIYEQVPSFDVLKEKLHEYLTIYNETIRGSQLDLVFFQDCMIHIIRVSRIIRTPQGNALLVGVGGSGKQSVTRLATSIARYQIFQIQLSRSYNANNLLEDIKQLYHIAGVKGQGVTFVMTDNEIKSEGFLEYINNLLATGEIGGLFARDEIDEITGELTPIMKKESPRTPLTNENLYDYFITRVRNNLHVVLCFSPVGEKFRSRAIKFPAVFSGCTMDWFMQWPKDALIAVADHFLSAFDIVCTPEVKTSVVETMGIVQDEVNKICQEYFVRFRRQTYVTPASYMSFLRTYRNVYDEKKTFVQGLAKRMNTGLTKLLEASESVAELSKELVVKEKDLAVASAETDRVLIEVTSSAAAAEKVKASVQIVKDKAQAIVDAIDADKRVAETKLAAAAPALAEAEAALQTIKPADISTVKKLGKPPHLIMRIMDCVLMLFGRRLDPVTQDPERPCNTPSWKEALKTMNGPMLQELMRFNKDTINGETVELMEPMLRMEDYSFESAKKVCGNVAGLLSWTKAMSFFYGVNKEVLPLKANLAIAEGKLQIAQKDLSEAQAELDAKQAELDIVQAKFDETMKKKQDLEDDANTCRRKMAAATALINGLGGEKDRWTEASKRFADQVDKLVGDVLIMCGFMSYSGPFNAEFRNLLMTTWTKSLREQNIPHTNKLDVVSELVDAATSGEWALQGLPTDELSQQNGIIVTKATRYPLLIDPQNQGKTWIKNREANNSLQVTSLNHKYFRTHLEDALSLGKPLLIEDVGEELDPCLDNVLDKNFIKAGSTYKVKVGDKEVDVMNGFMLYITTKLANPSYTPEVFARTSIIDFTVTMKGLEDQLLAKVIMTEKAELETERVALMTEVNNNKKKMKELEDNLLLRLTTTEGSLVDDESLIEVLGVTKQTAEEVNEKLAVAADTELKINTAREEYRPVATRGSILYFLIVEMGMVNCMYQTSLEQFLGIFNLSMEHSQKSPVPAKRINNIIEHLTYEAFKYTARGLYETHKFLFTLLLSLKIDLQRGKVKHNEFLTLIKGGSALDLNTVTPKPKSWILDQTWLNLVQLSELPQFSDILNQVARGDKAWKAWFDDSEPENAVIPDGYDNNLDIFRRLLLVRSWCPDRTVSQARKYIGDSMGQRYAEAVILDLDSMWGESNNRTPMVCLLSMGSDPTASIQALAKEKKVDCREVSMGQGQEVHARKLVQQFQETGGWTLLQNCHLGLGFLQELLDSVIETENVHEAFRLWITTEEHPKFPINLLQASIKFTNEPPQGMKAGLKRTYHYVNQDMLDLSAYPQWKPILYGVAFLHSTVQERRKYGPLGWNIPYEFNQGDLIASIQFCSNHLDDMDPKKGVAWPTVRYMLGEVHYGGRVTDDRDKRLLNTYCFNWFGEQMFQPEFEYYKGYKIPVCAKLEEYHDVIGKMSPVDKPDVFGLHSNADITYQTAMAKDVLGTILDIQPKESGGGSGETREDVVTRMCNEFLEKLPADFVAHEVRARLKKMGALSSMNIFLRQEIDRMQRVIGRVRTTLSDLLLAIDGTIIMSEDLRDALDSMYDARIPTRWLEISWTSSTLGFWFTELCERHAQFHTWCFGGRPNAFWLTGFFNPQGFITAMRQEITRAHKGWALDSVVCANEVTKMAGKDDVNSPPKEGVYIYGLYLDGAGWDRKNMMLCDQAPKVLFVPLPIIHIYAINSTAGRDKRQYECPIYRKPRRTDLEFVTMVDLKTNVNPDKWTFRGVALLCDTK